jgi:hypothetical protein
MLDKIRIRSLRDTHSRCEYIEKLVTMVLGDYTPTDVELLYIEGLAAEYTRANTARQGIKALYNILQHVSKLVPKENNQKPKGKRLKL